MKLNLAKGKTTLDRVDSIITQKVNEMFGEGNIFISCLHVS